ncbi:MAG: aldolase [Betaproteobacteria bacterium RIFCSPLOWO2_02_FULL_62_17]|nr:MAG: aldolase [Betaproteobacteria bacterium RIFCSPLOWO2_02_FULL_62_17]
MNAVPAHPRDALFAGEKPFPSIAVCEHIAGSEKLILKSLALQEEIGPLFDVTCDCEDGARPGQEVEHAKMVARVLLGSANRHRMAGARIHDATHPSWRRDVEILLGEAGEHIAYLTLPKVDSARQALTMIDHVRESALRLGLAREIPIHVLLETHGGIREAHQIAALPWMQTLDFGLMDLVSAHHGAIPASAMRSPGQFEHKLLVRAKSELAAAALAQGIVPAEGVTLDIRNPQTAHQDALRARREFGFLRKWSIHPSQIMPIIDAMKPEHSEVQVAAGILVAAQKVDWGPIQFEGEMHDRATYRYYWELLQKAKVTGMSLPAEAQQAFF